MTKTYVVKFLFSTFGSSFKMRADGSLRILQDHVPGWAVERIEIDDSDTNWPDVFRHKLFDTMSGFLSGVYTGPMYCSYTDNERANQTFISYGEVYAPFLVFPMVPACVWKNTGAVNQAET